MTIREWYADTMTVDGVIPEGVTVNEDGRADQSCGVCDELVDAWGGSFTAARCSHHVDNREEGMDWHIDNKGHACACIEEEHDDRPRISYAQAKALDEWDRKTERTG